VLIGVIGLVGARDDRVDWGDRIIRAIVRQEQQLLFFISNTFNPCNS
jgi:hypothetical protein